MALVCVSLTWDYQCDIVWQDLISLRLCCGVGLIRGLNTRLFRKKNKYLPYTVQSAAKSWKRYKCFIKNLHRAPKLAKFLSWDSLISGDVTYLCPKFFPRCTRRRMPLETPKYAQLVHRALSQPLCHSRSTVKEYILSSSITYQTSTVKFFWAAQTVWY